jgi:hypothetical protein
MLHLLGLSWHYLYPLFVAVSAILLNELLKDLGVDVYAFIKKLVVGHSKTLRIIPSKSPPDIRTSGYTKLTPNDLEITIPYSYHNGSDGRITLDDETIAYAGEPPKGLSVPQLTLLGDRAINKNSTVKTSFVCRINLDNYRVETLAQAMNNYLEILDAMPTLLDIHVSVQYYLNGKSHSTNYVLAIELRKELAKSWLGFLEDNPYTGPEHEHREFIVERLRALL